MSGQTAMPSWEPVRKGERYCAPACGRGCTWEEYQDAKRKCRALVKQLGPNWKARVHENMGWHYSAEYKKRGCCISVSQEPRHYVAWINIQGPGGRWGATGKTPLLAVSNVMALVDKEMNALRKLLLLARKASS